MTEKKKEEKRGGNRKRKTKEAISPFTCFPPSFLEYITYNVFNWCFYLV